MSAARTAGGVRWVAKRALAAILLAVLVAAGAAMASSSSPKASHDRAGNSWSQSVDSLTENLGS